MTPVHPNFIDGKEGVFYDLPDEDYRNAPGVSNSMIRHIALEGDEPGSPAHFLEQFKKPQKDTDAMFMGRMVHSRILTPDEPLQGIIEIPDTYPAPPNCTAVKQKKCNPGDPIPWHGGAKFCKEWIMMQELAGLRPMDKEDIVAMDGVVNAIIKDPNCQIAFREGKSEVSLFKRFYVSENSFVLRKARLDWVPPGRIIPDIKTVQDARDFEFAFDMWKRRYYVQGAYYLDLWNELNPADQKSGFAFIAVEKRPPFAVQVFEMDAMDIEDGRREYRRNLSLLANCIKTGEWPSYNPEPRVLKMRVPYNRPYKGPTP